MQRESNPRTHRSLGLAQTLSQNVSRALLTGFLPLSSQTPACGRSRPPSFAQLPVRLPCPAPPGLLAEGCLESPNSPVEFSPYDTVFRIPAPTFFYCLQLGLF